jgi:hypothetical protein
MKFSKSICYQSWCDFNIQKGTSRQDENCGFHNALKISVHKIMNIWKREDYYELIIWFENSIAFKWLFELDGIKIGHDDY